MKLHFLPKHKILRRVLFFSLAFACLFTVAVFAAEITGVGSVCVAGQSRADWDSLFQCIGTAWQRAPLWLGAATDTCDANHAGIIQWTGTAFQGCDGSNWVAF